MQVVKTIIIEDEKHNQAALLNMLKDYSHIEVLAVCSSNAEAKNAITSLMPDLVFSDIELQGETVFEMLQQLSYINFEIIFTTAHETYALQAIKFSALDYILKPFSPSDLNEAINRYSEKTNKSKNNNSFETLFHNLKNIQKESKKIALPTLNGLHIISLKDIIRCQADNNYTTFYLVGDKSFVVSKTLKDYEQMLEEFDFMRVHHSHLINLHCIKNYAKGDGGVVTLIDGTEVDVSRRKKDDFLLRLNNL